MWDSTGLYKANRSWCHYLKVMLALVEVKCNHFKCAMVNQNSSTYSVPLVIIAPMFLNNDKNVQISERFEAHKFIYRKYPNRTYAWTYALIIYNLKRVWINKHWINEIYVYHKLLCKNYNPGKPTKAHPHGMSSLFLTTYLSVPPSLQALKCTPPRSLKITTIS